MEDDFCTMDLHARLRLCLTSLAHKDEATAWHCGRVACHVDRLASALGLGDEVRERLRAGALVHDVGKIALPRRMLQKPGPLSTEEWRVMRRHPELGAAAARRLGLPSLICDIIEHHHEHWTGSGYPGALRGRAIPLSARLLTIADVFDALVSERPYREAYSETEALSVMGTECGHILDPAAFRAFREMLRGQCRPQVRVS